MEPHLKWRNSTHPVSTSFDDIYYADEDGLAEARYVFLEQNHLFDRWRICKVFSIAELGFGTGLSFLATWDLWNSVATPSMKLHYIACEKYPLSKTQMEKALSRWPRLKPLANKLLKQYEKRKTDSKEFMFEEGNIQLHLLLGDAFETFSQFKGNKIDAWYLDGFAPTKNPEMWSLQLFKALRDKSSFTATLSTFTSAGFVKRNLEDAGFYVQKFRGYGRKKEMLKGSVKKHPPKKTLSSTKALVIGGGIAGAATAYSLAERGFKVELVEREKEIAQKASGNKIGIYMPLLTAEPSDLGQLSFLSYHFLLNRFKQLEFNQWKPCGVLKLGTTKEEEFRLRRGLKAVYGSRYFAEYVDQKEASKLAGVPLQFGGVYYHEAGRVSPRDFCFAHLTNTHHIRRQLSTEIQKIEYLTKTSSPVWKCTDKTQKYSFEADILVIANAFDCVDFSPLSWLPIRKVRGQVLHTRENELTKNLKTVLCYDGYMIPSVDGKHIVGATYSRENLSEAISESDNKELLNRLDQAAPSLQAHSMQIHSSRVGIRTSTPGQIPILGPVCTHSGEPLKNLYLNVAHGSRGMTFAPFLGEILAAQICGENISLDERLLWSLSAQRHWDRMNRRAS